MDFLSSVFNFIASIQKYNCFLCANLKSVINSFIPGIFFFLWIPQNSLHKQSCHLQTGTVLFISNLYTIISSNIFAIPRPFSSHSGSLMTQMLLDLMTVSRFLRLLNSEAAICFSNWIIPINLFSNSLTLSSSVMSSLLITPIHFFVFLFPLLYCILFPLLYFSVLNFCSVLLYIFYFFAETFYLPTHSWNMIIIADFKSS